MKAQTAVFILYLVVALISVLPVKLAAGWVGAERDGWIISFLTLVPTAIINAIAGPLFNYGFIVALFVSALGYMLVLGTTYLRGVVVAIAQAVFSVILLFVLSTTVLFPFLSNIPISHK